MTIKNILNNRRSTRIRLLSGYRLSPIERQIGRAMRAPDEHTDDAPPADAADPAPTTALGDAATADPAPEDTTAVPPVTDGDNTDAAGDKKDGEGDDKTGADTADSIVGAPETYDVEAFTMPEGVEFDAELFDLVQDDLKGMDLSQKGAERVVGLFAEKVGPKIAERAAQQLDDHAAELRANMARDLQADKEVGGPKLKESQAYAAKAIAHFIPDATVRSDFSKFLNESGLGDHPLLTRVIAGAGRAISEASTPTGETAAAELTASEKFYGRKATT